MTSTLATKFTWGQINVMALPNTPHRSTFSMKTWVKVWPFFTQSAKIGVIQIDLQGHKVKQHG